MTVALLAIFVGGILLYAGIKGKSVTALLLGNSQTAAPSNPSISDQAAAQ